jgi:hypothetical protein
VEIIAIGDIHGRREIVDHILSDQFSEYQKVFIGDYLDSYNRSVEDQFYCLTTILDAVEERDDVVALRGNHENSYFKGEMCGGFNPTLFTLTTHVKKRERDLLLDFYVGNGVLFTHAGLHQNWIELHRRESGQPLRRDPDFDLEEISEFLRSPLISGNYARGAVGRCRGGNHEVGGIFWCDWFKEFESVPGLSQVVGHSGYRPRGERLGIIEKDGNYLIDCFEHAQEVLQVHEKGGATIVVLDVETE